MPSKATLAEGLFRRLHGRTKADMLLGRMSQEHRLRCYDRLKGKMAVIKSRLSG